jgi:heptosyltransferase-2
MNHLVILAPNWLGDAVMALPAIADVRRAAAAARIVAAARPSVAPLFALVPEIDETIVLDRPAALTAPGSWRALGAELLNRGFDTALVLPNSVLVALVASRAGIPERWGSRSALRNRLLTRSVAPPRRLHQVDFYQHLVGALGFPNLSAAPRIRVPEAARAAAPPQL